MVRCMRVVNLGLKSVSKNDLVHSMDGKIFYLPVFHLHKHTKASAKAAIIHTHISMGSHTTIGVFKSPLLIYIFLSRVLSVCYLIFSIFSLFY